MTFAFDGIRIIETASTLAGPSAGRLLADWGADVIRVESPVRGEASLKASFMRDGRSLWSDIDYSAQNVNRNKRSITLNLSHERGREILYKLLETADVFLSSFRPRELEKFKLGYDTLSRLNPRLICATMTGYGKKGPDRDLPGYDTICYWARTGMFHILQAPGTAPVSPAVGLGDYVAGLGLALGIASALFMREKTGVGQEVDVSLFQVGVFVLSSDIAGALVTGQDRQAVQLKDLVNALQNFYETKDGRWIRFSMVQPDLYWARFCRSIEREDLEHDPRFETFEPRIKNHSDLFNMLNEVFRAKTLDEWGPRLKEAGLPYGVLQTLPEICADPQARANDFYLPLDHPKYGRVEVVANPVKLSQSPEKVRMPAPEFNEHTEEVLLELGYTSEDIARFKAQGVIAPS